MGHNYEKKDKQLQRNDALDLLMQSKVISIGINTGEFPYVVPLNYACDVKGDEINLYIHCASEGRKLELLKANPKSWLLRYTIHLALLMIRMHHSVQLFMEV